MLRIELSPGVDKADFFFFFFFFFFFVFFFFFFFFDDSEVKDQFLNPQNSYQSQQEYVVLWS